MLFKEIVLKAFLWLGVIIVLCAINTASASRFEFSLYYGKMTAKAGSTTVVDADRTVKTSMENGTAAGLSIRANINSFLGLGTQFGMHGSNYAIRLMDKSNTPDEVPQEVSTKDNNPVGLLCEDLIIRCPLGRFEPYIFGGIGWTLYIDDKSFSTDYGAGINIFFAKHFAVRGEFRKYHTNLESSIGELFTPSYEKWGWVEFPFKDRLDFGEIYFGLVYSN